MFLKVCVISHMLPHSCGDQRTPLRTWFHKPLLEFQEFGFAWQMPSLAELFHPFFFFFKGYLFFQTLVGHPYFCTIAFLKETLKYIF